MRIVLARLQSLKAVALSNGNADAATAIDQMTLLGTPIDIQLPEVLMPPSDQTPAPDPLPPPTTIAEAHDQVQAGVITREEAVESGVISHVDQLAPSPAEVEAGVENVPPPVVLPQPVETPVAVDPAPVDPAPAAVLPETPVAPVMETPVGSGGAVLPEPAAPSAEPVAAVEPTPVAQGDAGDEDPTPADQQTMETIDQRLDALEGHPRGGKVSRQ